MNPDDIQQIGRVLSVLQTCKSKLEGISENSGEGTSSALCADNAAEWVGYAIDEVAKTLTFTPSKEFR